MDTIKKEYVKCRLCGIDTDMLGTELCDRCYELETRIERDVELAEKILSNIKKEKDRSLYKISPDVTIFDRIYWLVRNFIAWVLVVISSPVMTALSLVHMLKELIVYCDGSYIIDWPSGYIWPWEEEE